jgi:hypothetical protein
MTGIRFSFLVTGLFLWFSGKSNPTVRDSTQPANIAIVANFYLDSAFNGLNYRLGQTSIPRLFLPGLEFYNGVNMAIDSLNKEGHNLRVSFYDLNKKGQTMTQLTSLMETQQFSLVLGLFNNVSEQKQMAEFGLKNNVPVISVSYPNDGGIENNPFFFLINPTWQTHVKTIGSYLQRHYSGKKLLMVTKKGTAEEKITNLLKTGSDNLISDAQTLMMSGNSISDTLKYFLDSTRENIVVCGSFDETFAINLVTSLNKLSPKYNITVLGMASWGSISKLKGKNSNKLTIIYTSPNNYMTSQSRISRISSQYKNKYYSKPSDMAFKGYETMYHFSRLLLYDTVNFINNISSSYATVFSEYDFKPVVTKAVSGVPQYLENKKLYFLKYMNGELKEISGW